MRGTDIQRIPWLDGLQSAVVRGAGIAALDLRTEVPAHVVFDDHGAEVARLPIEAARGGRPSLRCAGSRCVVLWRAEGAVYSATVGRDSVGTPVRHDLRVLPKSPLWDLSPDGRRLAVTPISPPEVVIYDLDRATSQRVTCELCEAIGGVRFSPDGALLLVGERGEQFMLVKSDAEGHERVLWRGDPFITEFAPIDERHTVLSKLAFHNRWVLYESR